MGAPFLPMDPHAVIRLVVIYTLSTYLSAAIPSPGSNNVAGMAPYIEILCPPYMI